MDRQAVQDWVHRYNQAGMAGLASIRSGGRNALLTTEQMAELKQLAIKGPEPRTDKVVRWRCIDLREVVKQRFAVTPIVRLQSVAQSWVRLNQASHTKIRTVPDFRA